MFQLTVPSRASQSSVLKKVEVIRKVKVNGIEEPYPVVPSNNSWKFLFPFQAG